MFDLSWGEMAVIVVTAAVVIGPKDLPVVLRKAGRGWARLKHFGTDIRRQFDESPLGAELRAAEAEVARETSALRARTILGTDGKPYESFSLEGVTDHSRIPPELKPAPDPVFSHDAEMKPLETPKTSETVL